MSQHRNQSITVQLGVSFLHHTHKCLTGIVLYKLLEGLKLGSGGDVVASIVQLANLIVFDVVSLDVIPVLDGERVGPCKN